MTVKNVSKCMDALPFVKIAIEQLYRFLLCRMLRVSLWALGIELRTFSLESSVRLRLILTVSSDSVLVLNHRSCGDFKGTEDRMDSGYICSGVL